MAALPLFACAGQGTGHLSAARPDDPPALESVAPQLTADRFIASDGASLPMRFWKPEGEPKAIILALHGFNDYSRAFAMPAAEWAKSGIATYAYDQRGFGQAPHRGEWAGIRQLDEDVATVTHLLHARYPGVPLYLLGESMGGAVAITAVSGAAGAARPECDGVILVAPAVWGRATMNIFERTALWGAYHLFPDMTLTGRGLHITPSDNIEMLRALSRDPLVIKETRVDTLKGLVDLMDVALAAAPMLSEPMLLLYGAHDEIIPQEPVRQMIASLPPVPSAMRRIALYPKGYHMLLRDLDGTVVALDIESWIADRKAPLPSGADHDPSAARIAARE